MTEERVEKVDKNRAVLEAMRADRSDAGCLTAAELDELRARSREQYTENIRRKSGIGP